ncbi:MAG: MmcQ/YjbR family DNA-binding protein [Oscillospiraceae bacterium]|nr:MmcQ/YjbR family DNA-binding protein [Oscillospiraceae bacterium]
MQYDRLNDFLLSLPGAEKDYKAEWDWVRYRVAEKMFAALCTPDEKHGVYGGHPLLQLKCDPQESEFLRAQHPDILPGFYADKRCWIAIFLDGAVPEPEVRRLCAASYALVFKKLTKKQRLTISEQKNGGSDV